MLSNFFQRISESPTNPHKQGAVEAFDVADLYRGPVTASEDEGAKPLPLDEKLRQAYFWIINHAVISPFYDIEYYDGPSQSYIFGDAKGTVTLPSGQSYCSFILLPLLTFAVRAKCLLVGGPGRGKTSSAILTRDFSRQTDLGPLRRLAATTGPAPHAAALHTGLE